jgi:hypothetical protein
MRVGTEIPRVGTTFEWDVAEILERWSHDLYYNFEGNGYARECVVCGTIWTSDGSWGGTGDPCPRDDCEDFRDVPMARLWDLLLNEKRENEHFGDVLESVTRNGIVRPLTAYEREGVLDPVRWTPPPRREPHARHDRRAGARNVILRVCRGQRGVEPGRRDRRLVQKIG